MMCLGCPRLAGTRHIRNMGDGISGAGVFGERSVIQIDVPRAHVHGDVFENRAETPGGFVNLRLALARQLDDFGVAATFKIEDSVIAPAMFVVANQRALGIGRQGCLSRA